jgi:hypothetical protein
MTVSPTHLTRTAGVAAAASGLLFGLVQFIHPVETVSAVETTRWAIVHYRWAIVHYLTIAMAVLGLAGVTGSYLRQVRQTGVLGAVTLAAPVGFAFYLLGGLAFGVALFRAGILARWAGLLLAAGTVLPLAVPLVPHQIARGAAIPVGIAMIGLGVSRWRGQRSAGPAPVMVDQITVDEITVAATGSSAQQPAVR